MDCVEQGLVPERLGQDVDRALAERQFAQLVVGVGGDEDDRDVTPPEAQPSLEFEAAHARHADVEDQAARIAIGLGLQEFLGGREGHGGEAGGADQRPQRLAHGVVVVDDCDQRLGTGHRLH